MGICLGSAEDGGIEAQAMKGLTPRIYREYCWFALLLLLVAIGLVSRPPLADMRTRAVSSSAPAAGSPP
ncbi:MAG: hypothetical protein ABSG30_00620 [Steroidobacteraceae bacterium]|jgi:hypothetical protein